MRRHAHRLHVDHPQPPRLVRRKHCHLSFAAALVAALSMDRRRFFLHCVAGNSHSCVGPDGGLRADRNVEPVGNLHDRPLPLRTFCTGAAGRTLRCLRLRSSSHAGPVPRVRGSTGAPQLTNHRRNGATKYYGCNGSAACGEEATSRHRCWAGRRGGGRVRCGGRARRGRLHFAGVH